MKIAVYPGSFDPVTNGHLDIIERAAKLYDKVIVAILHNNSKSPAFTLEQRTEMLRAVTAGIKNVEIDSFGGMLVKFAKKRGASVIIKGLRAVSDFEYEFQMALINKKQSPDIETLFMTTSSGNSFLSSSVVKEVASLGGELEGMVPSVIIPIIYKKLLAGGSHGSIGID